MPHVTSPRERLHLDEIFDTVRAQVERANGDTAGTVPAEQIADAIHGIALQLRRGGPDQLRCAHMLAVESVRLIQALHQEAPAE